MYRVRDLGKYSLCMLRCQCILYAVLSLLCKCWRFHRQSFVGEVQNKISPRIVSNFICFCVFIVSFSIVLNWTPDLAPHLTQVAKLPSFYNRTNAIAESADNRTQCWTKSVCQIRFVTVPTHTIAWLQSLFPWRRTSSTNSTEENNRFLRSLLVRPFDRAMRWRHHTSLRQCCYVIVYIVYTSLQRATGCWNAAAVLLCPWIAHTQWHTRCACDTRD